MKVDHLNRELDGSHEIRITVNSCERDKTELLLSNRQLKESKDGGKKGSSDKQENQDFFAFYVVALILSYLKALVRQQMGVFIKYLSYIYLVANHIYERGTRLEEKYKILEYLCVLFQIVLRKIKTINDKYMFDQKIKKLNSKYNILDTVQEKGRIIVYNSQYTINKETRNKIQVFYTELRRKCRNIHEEAYKLASLKQQKVKIQ